MEISEDSFVCWSKVPVATQVNAEVVLMNLERDRCYGLGETGSDIWRLLHEPIRVSDLVSKLKESYEGMPGQIEADVMRALREFAAEGLIEVRHA